MAVEQAEQVEVEAAAESAAPEQPTGTAEEQAFEALKAQYDHSELEGDDLWPEAEEPEAEVEAEAAEVEAAPAPTAPAPATPRNAELLRQARELQIDPAGMTDGELGANVRAARAEWRAEQLEQKKAKEEAPAEKDPLDELAEDIDPRLMGVVRSMKSELTSLKQQNAALVQQQQQREADAFSRDFDNWIAETGDEEFFGAGELSPVQTRNRGETLLLMDGINAAYRSKGIQLSSQELFAKATQGVRAATKTRTAAKAPAKTKAAPAAAAPAPASEPAELARRKAVYSGAAVATPTQRQRDEAPGINKATRFAASFMKEHGMTGDDDLDAVE